MIEFSPVCIIRHLFLIPLRWRIRQFLLYTFSCGTVLLPSKISSSFRSDYLHVNSFFIITVSTYFIEQPSTIHSVDTELVYAAFKLSFSKQYKIWCFNPLRQSFSNFFVLRPHFEKRFLYAAPLMDSLDVNDTFERLITNLRLYL